MDEARPVRGRRRRFPGVARGDAAAAFGDEDQADEVGPGLGGGAGVGGGADTADFDPNHGRYAPTLTLPRRERGIKRRLLQRESGL